VKYARIYADEDGESHFEDIDASMSPVDFAPPALPMDLSALIPSSAIGFLGVPAGWYGEPHPSPRRQFILFLAGQAEASASDGALRRCLPGSVFLLEDTTGKGHDLRVLGAEYLLMAVVRLAD
jgi:hypothetical protein